ncbi:papilin-like [Anneissia japonica]|uniref:papilin-like n=1 Tax=Anneissia japonica TaxID=1529436 RepID=UPI001425559C|nr:papilin-like [Anneissia japonica]
MNLSLWLNTMFKPTVLLFIFCLLRSITGAPVEEEGNENSSCSGKKDPGYGPYIYSKWYYDVGDKICKPFNYLGSGGNGNRFPSYESCSLQCNSCCFQSMPINQNNSCDGGGFEWAYHQGRGVCLPFKNSTCGSADNSINRFPTKRECERDCLFYGVSVPPVQNICPRINTHDSVCNSEFIVSGRVSSISVEIYSEYLVNRLVVEVSETYKGRNLLPIYNVTKADNSTAEFLHIKKILVEGRNCYNIETAVTYVFMGYTQYNNMLIDDSSYVQVERTSVLSKINTFLNMCPA